MCYPCGIVIACQPYHLTEAPLKLLDWLKKLFPVGAEMPDVIVYDDNACTVAKSIRPGAPQHIQYQQLADNMWIMDRFHFSGHSAGDIVCRT